MHDPFKLAALATLERAVLYLFPYLNDEIRRELLVAVGEARVHLKVPIPAQPLLDLRDLWPGDAIAAQHLERLLKRLTELEREP